MSDYTLAENIKKTQAKNNEFTSDAYIQEQAENMVGGRSQLESAVARGAVRVAHQAGLQMFVFPHASSAMTEEVWGHLACVNKSSNNPK